MMLNIKKLRKQKGLSQTDIAMALGLTQPYIAQIENNQRVPSTDVLLAIASVLDVDAEELYVVDMVDAFDVFEDRTLSLLERWRVFKNNGGCSPEDAIKNCKTEITSDLNYLEQLAEEKQTEE